jgi:hypothetical protein
MTVVFVEVISGTRSDVWAGAMSWRKTKECCATWLDTFPRLLKNITIEVSIHDLYWRNKFLMHNAFGIKKTHTHQH